MIDWFWTGMPQPFNEEKIVYLINDASTTVHGKGWGETPDLTLSTNIDAKLIKTQNV